MGSLKMSMSRETESPWTCPWLKEAQETPQLHATAGSQRDSPPEGKCVIEDAVGSTDKPEAWMEMR